MEGDADDAISDSEDSVPRGSVTDDDEDDADDAMHEGNPPEANGVNEAHGRGDAEECTFDPALPVRHSYLGTNFEEIRGRTLLDDDSYQTLPILPERGVVLVPGQTLPLSIFYSPTISMLRRTITTDRTFGVVCIRYGINHVPVLADIGTTAEIYEFQDDEETAGFKIKAKGRQRFRIVETQRHIDGNISARVQILPEVLLRDPLVCTLGYWKQLKINSICTSWPSWVFSQYQAQRLVAKILQLLSHLKLGTGTSLPTDPVELSYWVAQSIPLGDEQKLILLRIDSAVQRLRWEISVLEKCRILCCRKCSTKIAHQEDVFSMSVEGPQGTYVNSGGYVHDTITVYKAKGLKCASDQPSTEYSWFPGYAWTICECRRCLTHMGWKFTATRSDLRPATFWGLCRRSLAPKFQSDEDGEAKPVM